VINLDYHGTVCITRGHAKEDRSETRSRRKIGKSEYAKAGEPQSPPNGGLSDRLLEDLTAHRTAALRAVLAGHPRTALS